jgi:hypothetical protein
MIRKCIDMIVAISAVVAMKLIETNQQHDSCPSTLFATINTNRHHRQDSTLGGMFASASRRCRGPISPSTTDITASPELEFCTDAFV